MADDVILLPWPDHASSLGGATDGLEVHVWSEGEPAPPDDVLARVTFYVPAYLGGRPGLEAMGRMPALRPTVNRIM